MRRVSALPIISAAIMIDLLLALTTPATTLPEPQFPPELAEAPLRLPTSSNRNRPADSDNDRPPVSPSEDSGQAEFKYRLIVQGSSDNLLRQVRRIVPDAFRTLIDGRRVIQAGLFVERQEAEAVQQQLDRLNAETDILAIDQTAAQRPLASSRSSSRSSASSRTGFNYRLVVQGSSDSLLRQVRRLVPDAFRTTIDGHRVIQAGLFVEREEAEVIQQQLDRINAETNIFDVSYGIANRQPSPSQPFTVRDGRVAVVVDPGHGGRDVGAVGIGGIHEADIVLDIAQEVAAQLEEQGIQAILTRSDDREIDLAPRVNLAESINANLFVSIHANAINLSRPDVNGIETYYYDTGASLATSIHNSLVSATGMEDRGVRQARFYVLTRTSMPAVLVEVGFVTGREDAVKLSSSTFRNQIATGIVQGILQYVR